jgi:ethanolaminephosphotransferase
MLTRNARQLLNTVQATFPGFAFTQEATAASCATGADSGIEGAQCAWSEVLHLSSGDITDDETSSALESSLLRFSRIAQDVMSSTASNYDISRLCLGLVITGIAALLVFPNTYYECAQSTYTGVFLAFMIVGYGSMMFASSYVEEEQQFWYWICSGWMFYLHVRSASSRTGPSRATDRLSRHGSKLAIVGLAVAQRVVRRWNQTGQKFAAEPDIARTFFPAHPAVFWGLFMITYGDAGYHLLRSLPSSVVLKVGGVALTALAFMFKLNFVANDSPELLVGSSLSKTAEKWPESLSLVLQARLIFGGLVCCALLAIMARYRPGAKHGEQSSLPSNPSSKH